MKTKILFLLLLLGTLCRSLLAQDDVELTNRYFRLGVSKSTGAVVRLEHAGDPDSPNFVMSPGEHPEFAVPDSRWVGDLVLRYRVAAGEWQHASTGNLKATRRVSSTNDGNRQGIAVDYTIATGAPDTAGLDLRESYELADDTLSWSITLRNRSAAPVEIGDLGLPLLFDSFFAQDPAVTYQRRVIRHSYVQGDGSYLFWMRPDGLGPFLLMTPAAGTHLEYFTLHTRGDHADVPPDGRVFARREAWEGLYTAYIHAKVQSSEHDRMGTWRQPITSKLLNPAGQAGSDVTYRFVFRWADGYPGVRDALARNGSIDVEVAPGMVIPSDLAAHFSLRTNRKIAAVEPEFPDQTTLQAMPSADAARSVYKVYFRRLGENRLTIRYGDGLRTQLEYFVTEPIETLLKKRSAFIVRNQQVRDPSKWFDGLFGLWSMPTASIRTPENRGDLDPYMVGGSDDPDLCKAPYIAAKNILYPKAEEIEAVEYYLSHFVWGKLQRTDAETPFPFGIYGTPNWHELRNSKIGLNSGGNGQEHLWRTYDYAHLIQLYYEMYRIASLYPNLVHYATADEYLQRAYGTAKAFFEVPYQIKMGEPWFIRGWSDWAYKQGNFHELFLLDVIDALARDGHPDEAKALRTYWEKKVLYFLYDHPLPYGSEMFFDTTAFESTHAIAKYAAEHTFDPREAAWTDKNTGRHYEHTTVRPEDVAKFTQNEIRANIAARGYLEPTCYQLGSDIRQDGNANYLLSYMTQMGGWSLLDYGLQAPLQRIAALRLGYASYLAGWADINSGTPESNYGYWFPGPENDGAAGWGFNPGKAGTMWIPGAPKIPRGIWPYDGEVDSGFSGALRAASTVVVNDPVFGLLAYGGDVEERDGTYRIICRDGVRQRLSIFALAQPMQIALAANRFGADQPVAVNAGGSELSLPVEAIDPVPPSSPLAITGLPPGDYEVSMDGKSVRKAQVSGGARLEVNLPLQSVGPHQIEVHKTASR